MEENLNEVVGEFVVEAQEHLENIESELLQIEENGVDLDHDLVNKVFRAIHSIKGASGFLALDTIGELSHALENVLDLVRKEKLVPDSEVVNAMLGASDVLRQLIDDVAHSNEVDVSEHMASLTTVAQQSTEESAADAPEDVPSDPVEPQETVIDAKEEDGGEAGPGPSAPSPDPAPATGVAVAPPPPSTQKVAPKRAESPVREGSIRVPVSLLDGLMNLAGELVLGRNQLLQTVATGCMDDVSGVAGRLSQVTSDLQAAVMQTRMQPIGNVFTKFPRVVRDLCQKLDKQAELVLEGQDVDLDKSLIEAIGDPLTHLVRNSIDHGMETPDERESLGKPRTGTVQLRAFHLGGKVNVEIADDGKGIDTEQLKKMAVLRGVISGEEAHAMGHREALNLIFRPGFSTAETVTDVSGRGVGMDVVRSNLESLGGTVEIASTLGEGTTITIKIPLTLAIMAAMIVSVSGMRYAVPQSNIRELVRVRADERAERIGEVRGREVLRLRGHLLPLVHLDAIVRGGDAVDDDSAEGAEPSSGAVTVVVVESGAFRYGISVDSRLDAEEIVVKPLGRCLSNCTEYSGATILGDGTVAMILDINGIATNMELRAAEEEAHDGESTLTAGSMDSLVLFRNHPEERFAVSLEMVARIERIESKQIQHVAGREVYECRGRALPLVRLEDTLTTRPMPEKPVYFVLVTSVHGHEAGILMPTLEDIRDLDLAIDSETINEPGVCGSFQLEGSVVRLVDVCGVVQKAFPSWFDGVDDINGSSEERPIRILFAEDSRFFRNKVERDLTGEGFSVVGCEDGALAWKELNDSEETFDLIITDLEMPNMNGLEFTQKVKSTSRFANIPVIALTSLGADDDLERGRETGFDEYQVKFDKPSLMAAVHRLAGRTA